MSADHYEVLGIDRHASSEEITAAFDLAIEARRAKRQRTADLHAAYAVLSEPTLRSAYDLARFGASAARIAKKVADKATEVASQTKDAIPEVDFEEVARDAWRTTLKSVVLVSGATARVADATGALSRRLQTAAAQRLSR